MNMRKCKIGFLSTFNPIDRRVSSGTAFKMAQQLSLIGDVEWIPIKLNSLGLNLCRIEKYSNKLLPKSLMVRMTNFGSKNSYKPISAMIYNKYDVLAAFFCSSFLANITTSKPIVYFSDATFPAMVDYHPDFSNLWGFNVRQGYDIERRAILNASHAVYCSNWAAASAIHDLNIPAERVSVVELGPNIDTTDILPTDAATSFVNRQNIKLLFIGVNWIRKGGKKAVETCEWLNSNGIEASIYIVGVDEIPPEYSNKPYVKLIGFLDKNKPEEYQRLTEIIKECSLLILPTMNECAGIAFSEASAYGLPIITHDTGGIANYVINNYNGYRLPLTSTSEDFGRVIQRIITTGELPQLSRNAISLYKEKLNYTVWRKKVKAIIDRLI